VHVIIAGCGRVGAQLATALSVANHDVVIIDKNHAAFRRLGRGFSGTALAGIVFERTTLEKAGVRQAQAFVAVTSGDNSNIVAARTAKERYGVERVVARIYDPDRAAIYERLGITTIASARWTAETILRELLPVGERVDGSLGPGAGEVVLLTQTLPPGAGEVSAGTLGLPGGALVAAVTRAGHTTVAGRNTLLEPGDQLHLAVERRAVDAVRERLAVLGTAGAGSRSARGAQP
jgi:trk system potassium uptake protein